MVYYKLVFYGSRYAASLPVIQTVTSRPRDIQARSEQWRQDLAFYDGIIDDGFYFVCCDAAIPNTRSLGDVYLFRVNDVEEWYQHGTVRTILTIQLPTYLCPPTCEFIRTRARLASGSFFSVSRTCSSFSKGVPWNFSSGGPETEWCSSWE